MFAPSVSISVFSTDDTMRAIPTAAALCCALALSGCGIKGPLYLPQVPPAPAKAAPAAGVDHSKAPKATDDSR
ncbi:lipoprotein [Aromatoleum toluolicum]|nr:MULTISPECIES: lipoprotein [Rhodocyclales]NMF99799.2 lipoprotein [Aromatoleum toluolicum]